MKERESFRFQRPRLITAAPAILYRVHYINIVLDRVFRLFSDNFQTFMGRCLKKLFWIIVS